MPNGRVHSSGFSERRTPRSRPCHTPHWPRRGCASCSWPPASGAMPAKSASATATITRRKARFSSSWTGCAKSLADRMDLRPSSTRRYVLDSITRIAHSFLCTCRSTVSNTYRTGLKKSETGGNSEAQATDKTRMLNRSGTGRVLKLCIIQVRPDELSCIPVHRVEVTRPIREIHGVAVHCRSGRNRAARSEHPSER